ncbi:hypothetical protein [Methanobacterium ferruginis]|uniref:hypothetical protein n=1 Tax=Methanobacterium ferruginis TaxID=710191 RepID=UPI0025738BB7|nr:hypothetical protein [Methanobacterium ferruginis]BDZ68567.1 hypothetical protein GCM10025860_20150 [Methanobacterium ferruginis]
MAKTKIVSARIEPWVIETLKNHGLTTRDALEYVAELLSSPDDLVWEQIRRHRVTINKLELECEAIMGRTDEILEEIKSKESEISKLEKRLKRNPEDMAFEKAGPAIASILKIAKRFNCEPWEINRFTGHDTLTFQANKVGLTKTTLEELLKREYEIKNSISSTEG